MKVQMSVCDACGVSTRERSSKPADNHWWRVEWPLSYRLGVDCVTHEAMDFCSLECMRVKFDAIADEETA